MKFKYRARDKDAAVRQGFIEASDRRVLLTSFIRKASLFSFWKRPSRSRFRRNHLL